MECDAHCPDGFLRRAGDEPTPMGSLNGRA